MNTDPGRRLKIGFVGLAAGVGATTLAFSAAEYLASRYKKTRVPVTMLELNPGTGAPAGWSYDKVGIDKRFAGRDFLSIYRIASENKPLKDLANIDEGINWALRVPTDREIRPSASVLFRLLHNVYGDIIVCDIPAYIFLLESETRRALPMLLADLDRIICIFDPLPSSLLAAVPAAEICRALPSSGSELFWVFNKINPGADVREAERFTGLKNYIPFPSFPAETVYRAEYACRSLAGEPEAEEALSVIFR